MTRREVNRSQVLQVMLTGLGLSWCFTSASAGCSLVSLDYLEAGGHRDGGTSAETGPGAGGAGLGAVMTNGDADRGANPDGSAGGSSESGGMRTSPPGDASADGAGVVHAAGGANPGGAGATAGGADAAVGGAGVGGGGVGGGGVGGGAVGGNAGVSEGGPPDVVPPSAMVYDVPGQSCSGGLECPGAVSCCAQLEVPGGTFSMGTNTDALRRDDESPPHSTEVDSFFLDEFEVTVGRFRRFVNAFDGTMPPIGAGSQPAHANSGWQADFVAGMPTARGALLTQIQCNAGQYQSWTNQAGARDAMPMNCVNWYVALAFCIWDGGRLPTEAEWEEAAAGGAVDSRFPWGNGDPDPATHAVMSCLAAGAADAGCHPTDLLPVGSRPAGAGRWGHRDLAGSVWEWNLDFYDPTYYQAVATGCDNCVSLLGTTPRVIRGGDFASPLVQVRATNRGSKPPVTADPYTGFRCARSRP